ncbi:DinB family protein [Allomuricauda sp. SCSIO 65647]|uniref:DinB family protein n=1 Tax=Allomuricauda sp. SCSIO 65647 TaxID=2908843 RepID=UPI001F15B7B0|nr:DinB family protein [Muricauda sp. SCSIO 65647]UJH67217.1 DinB family protein [Muricauda sp. SCSIO 65647]
MVYPSDLAKSEYHSFYGPYIKALGQVDLMKELVNGKQEFADTLQSIALEKLSYRYEENKWSVAEVLMHIVDAERVFQYRALRFARNDGTPLPGFDQDAYVPESKSADRERDAIFDEYETVRNASISLFRSFDAQILERVGVASGYEMSVRALGFVICGHQKHHLKILKERYL